MAKAELTYAKITFADISTGAFCTVQKVTIDKTSRGNPKDDGGRISLSGTTIINDRNYNNGRGQIGITIGDPVAYPNADDDVITPKGFALIAKASSNPDQDGLRDFNSRSHNESLKTITMNALHANGYGARWKVMILVQHDDGRVGVIDPDIENDN